MDIFAWIKGLFGDKGIAGTVMDAVEKYWPPDVSPEKKAEFQMAVTKEMHCHELAILEAAHKQDQEFNQRIKDLEGTAADLKSIPILGTFMIFLRGCQRPIWGLATLAIDYMWFSGGWEIPDGSQKSNAFIAINVLVLGFLFGERAMQNVMPYIIQFFGVKNCSQPIPK